MPRKSNPPQNTKLPMKIPEHRNLPALIPQRPSFLQTMKEGVALGIGSSIGHRIVGAIIGPSQVETVKKDEYEQCMKDNNDKTGCEHILKTKY